MLASSQATLYELRRSFWNLDGPRPPTYRRGETRSSIYKNWFRFGSTFHYQKFRSKATQKSFIFLFVCFSSRAIQIEPDSALTTSACIAGIKRFVSRRGLPSIIYSDNGTNFIGARNELTTLQDLLSTRSDCPLTPHPASCGVELATISPTAPHFGGLWQAGVKSC